MNLVSKLRDRVKTGHVAVMPSVLKNFARNAPPTTPTQWRNFVRKLTEAFYKRFWFYHPVKCGGAPWQFVSRPKVRGRTEIYTCPNGTRREFKRFTNPANFFKWRYGRGGEFAQGLYSVLKFLGFRSRLCLGFWGGRADALWVEVWHPWTRSWVTVNPTVPHGYGWKFPKAHMKVWAIESANSPVVNRTKNYVCKKGCLPTFAESRRRFKALSH